MWHQVARVGDVGFAVGFSALLGVIGCQFSHNLQIGGTAGAGFAGLRSAEQLQKPAYCRSSTTCRDTLLTDSVDLVKNYRYSWRPALSTGVVLHWFPSTVPRLGMGLGAHVVFVPNENGVTNPFPAVTLHLGSPDYEMFLGMIFSPTDRVEFPNGAATVRVASGAGKLLPNFILPNTGYSRHLYLGIQIAGSRTGEAYAQAAAGPQVASVTFEKDEIHLPLHSTIVLQPQVIDSRGTIVHTAVLFTSDNTQCVTVDPWSGMARGIDSCAAASTSVRAESGGKRGVVKIFVESKPAP